MRIIPWLESAVTGALDASPTYGTVYGSQSVASNLSASIDTWLAGIPEWLTVTDYAIVDTQHSGLATAFGTDANGTYRYSGIQMIPGVTINSGTDGQDLTSASTWDASAANLAAYVSNTGATEFVVEAEGFLSSIWAGTPSGMTVPQLAVFQAGLGKWKTALNAAGVTRIYFWPGFSEDTDAYGTGTLADILTAINNGLAPKFITSRGANPKYLTNSASGGDFVAAEQTLLGITGIDIDDITPVIWPYWWEATPTAGSRYQVGELTQALQGVVDTYPHATEVFVLCTHPNFALVGQMMSALWSAY